MEYVISLFYNNTAIKLGMSTRGVCFMSGGREVVGLLVCLSGRGFSTFLLGTRRVVGGCRLSCSCGCKCSLCERRYRGRGSGGKLGSCGSMNFCGLERRCGRVRSGGSSRTGVRLCVLVICTFGGSVQFGSTNRFGLPIKGASLGEVGMRGVEGCVRQIRGVSTRFVYSSFASRAVRGVLYRTSFICVSPPCLLNSTMCGGY